VADFRLLRDYLPAAAETDSRLAVQIEELTRLLGADDIRSVPVPHDCVDGFAAAFWRRPEAYRARRLPRRRVLHDRRRPVTPSGTERGRPET
jgi:hypothetical protein